MDRKYFLVIHQVGYDQIPKPQLVILLLSQSFLEPGADDDPTTLKGRENAKSHKASASVTRPAPLQFEVYRWFM